MNLAQEGYIVVIVVGLLILSIALFMQPTQEEIIESEFSDYTLFVKDTGDTCACDCVVTDDGTNVYVNRPPQFVGFGAEQ